ncbi:MerR family transcriptional regulator [Streptomyces rimosus]|uniref:MerR family transcriptional regulator n=1 Tax=Streptomyces rimosus TaxID=1927 RepID=UPI0031E40419
MSDDRLPLFTIGQLARCTGVPVRTLRYWSDLGVVSPVRRSPGGYRLYDAACVARLQLVRTLRELGIGLEGVHRVLQQEAGVAEVAAAHVHALDTQIRALRLNRAVLATVARRQSDTEELELMNKLARLSARERAGIIEDFTHEVFDGLDADPRLREQMCDLPPQLPDNPTPRQVDAWIALAELVTDPGFRHRMRRLAQHHAQGRSGSGPGRRPGAFAFFAKKVTLLVTQARESGVDPTSGQAAAVLEDLLGTGPGAPCRAEVLERIEASLDAQAERYEHLLALLRGDESRPATGADYRWLVQALRAHG